MRKLNYLLLILPSFAFAGSSAGGISQVASVAQTLQDTVTGPMGCVVSVVAICGAGMAWAMSDHNTGVRKFSAVAAGVVVIVNAAAWLGTIFGATV